MFTLFDVLIFSKVIIGCQINAAVFLLISILSLKLKMMLLDNGEIKKYNSLEAYSVDLLDKASPGSPQ